MRKVTQEKLVAAALGWKVCCELHRALDEARSYIFASHLAYTF